MKIWSPVIKFLEHIAFSVFGVWLMMFLTYDLKIMPPQVGGFLITLLVWLALGKVCLIFMDTKE